MEVEIRRYQKELQIPFIYVTHNQEEALTMSDRIAVMRSGTFEQVGAKIEVYRNPRTAFVASFVGQANRFEGRLVETMGELARMEWRGHSILVPRPRDAAAGDGVQYSVKYEDLEIAGGVNGFEPKDRNWLGGTLRDVIFKGQTANYIITLADGTEIVASGTPRALSLQPHEPVVVHWPVRAGSSFAK
jgi:ABC-type Fe3+/spermidine/putrescine transport system ATPase subunit